MAVAPHVQVVDPSELHVAVDLSGHGASVNVVLLHLQLTLPEVQPAV
jgi:hypothetical protein